MSMWTELAVSGALPSATDHAASLIACAPKLLMVVGLSMSTPTEQAKIEPVEHPDNRATLVEMFNSSTENNLDLAYLPISDSNTIDQPTLKVVHQSETRDWASAYQQLRAFRNLNDGWDGYGSEAPAENVISNSLRLLDGWDRNLEVDVDLSVLKGGEISFELYSLSDLKLIGAVDVFADGGLSFAMSVGGIGNKFGTLHLDSPEDRSQLFGIIKEAIGIL